MALTTGTALLGGALAAGTIGGAAITAGAAKKAASQQAAAADRSAEIQRQMFERQVELQEPFRQGGLAGQNRMLELLGIGGNAGAAGYGMAALPFSQTNFMADPGYAFRLSEGMKALERGAAARGLLKSGGSIKAGQRYAQDLASQEYQNAFKRYYDEREALLSPLNALRTGGQLTAGNIAQQAGQYGTNLASTLQGGANALAAGRVGAANAWGNALGQSASMFSNYLASQPLSNALSSVAPSVASMGPIVDMGSLSTVNMAPISLPAFS